MNNKRAHHLYLSGITGALVLFGIVMLFVIADITKTPDWGSRGFNAIVAAIILMILVAGTLSVKTFIHAFTCDENEEHENDPE
ncbi:MAG: hypothetical protein QF793_04110 [Candidatus Peribacteraceae bacterium]|jgi:predicted tellurium resistance membrane protein TerC|nr:hypothetical protein [Candidatus Peribacteraceae bacterium]|tara:strand:+ start:985 stop:1233 length:249 start_codon:yes stop_codon:yes gene_type:complete